MLRLRSQTGTVTEVPDAHFVEICDDGGKIARVLYQDENGVIRVLRSSDPEAKNYAGLFNLELTKVVPISTST